MADKKINSLQGVDVRLPNQFYEEYDRTNDYRRYGYDNLYPQQVRQFFKASPTLNKCVTRMAENLFGNYRGVGLLSPKLVEKLIGDYCLFGGFALHVTYSAFGEVDGCNYVPFESIRLGEQNAQGVYTYCYYCADWSGTKTANRKKINPRQDSERFWIFTSDVETRLQRMESVGGAENYKGEIMYFSNTISYPTSIESILPIVSMECGIINALYRDVRCNAMPSMIVSVPLNSANNDDFAENLAKLQGDCSVGKIALYEYASAEEKPEMMNLSTESYDSRFENSKVYIESKIVGFFKQEVFSRIESGALGFSTDIVEDAYRFYNFSLRPQRRKIEAELRKIEPSFTLAEIHYNESDSITE